MGSDILCRSVLYIPGSKPRALEKARTLAVEALLERVRPTPDDALAMRVLLSLEVPVVASNAISGRIRASDALGLVAVPVEASAPLEGGAREAAGGD